MEIILVGTGTGVPNKRRHSPCILIRFNDKVGVFDSGPGTLRTLLGFGVNQLNLDYIFYTHLHLDHVSEFGAILFAAKILPTVRAKKLIVYGPPRLPDYYEKLKGLYEETICTDAYELDIRNIENKSIELEGHRISASPIKHHGGGMGYRIRTPEGKIAVYTGDTDYCKEVVGLSKEADMLITECSFPDIAKMMGHLSPSTAARIASEAHVKKLVLVHMYPVCDEYDLITPCRKVFDGEVIIGEDMMKFNL